RRTSISQEVQPEKVVLFEEKTVLDKETDFKATPADVKRVAIEATIITSQAPTSLDTVPLEKEQSFSPHEVETKTTKVTSFIVPERISTLEEVLPLDKEVEFLT